MNINKAIIIGRLTKDPEVRKTASDISVVSFTVACDRMKTRDNPEPGADFIACAAWRQTADFLGNYARKGNMVAVEGRISTRNYDDKDGRRVYVTEVVADEVHLLGGRKNDFDVAREQYQQQEEQQQKTTTKSARRNGPPTMNGQAINTEDVFGYDDTLPSVKGDDLPFY